MTIGTGFIENVLKSFKNIIKEIEKGSSEHDVRYRFVKYFIEEVLGYEPKYIKWEKKKADLTILDENNFAVIKIETKRPTESIDKKEHEDQAFKYEEETTRFICLTNFLQFKLWEIKKTGVELRLNLDFSKIVEQRNPIVNLSFEEKSQILYLQMIGRGMRRVEGVKDKVILVDIADHYRKGLQHCLNAVFNLDTNVEIQGDILEKVDERRREMLSPAGQILSPERLRSGSQRWCGSSPRL